MLSTMLILTKRKSSKKFKLRWDSPEVLSWKKEASDTQQHIYDMLGGEKMKPYFYGHSNRIELERKIAYAMYGPPTELPNVKKNSGTGYKKKHLKIIRKVCTTILKQAEKRQKDKVPIVFIFVCVQFHHAHLITPVFRIPLESSDVMESKKHFDIYVDCDHRVYQGWGDYLHTNKLPKCFMCYPPNGLYTATEDKVDIEFGESPACSTPEKVFNAIDVTTSLVATALGITAIAMPVSVPVLIAATVGGFVSGIIGLSRHARTLVDRHTHGQTVGLNSEEARDGWLGVLGNTMGMALGGVNMLASQVVHGGRLVGLNVGAFSLTIGASTVKGLSLVDHFADIGEKLSNEDSITPLDAFQLVSSVFFFTGSIVSTQSAYRALQQLKALEEDVKITEVMKAVKSKSDLQAEVRVTGKSTFDGEEEIEEPEVHWPKFESSWWKCNIL